MSCRSLTVNCCECCWLQKELVVYPDKDGSVGDLLREVRKQITLSKDGSGQLRSVCALGLGWGAAKSLLSQCIWYMYL